MAIPIEHREYQQRIITKAIEAYNTNYKSILIESPTGSGKTVVGLSICKALEEKLNIKINWVAMRRKLLAQAAKENERIGVKNINFMSMFDKNPPQADFMVTDEAQHDSADTCTTLHNTTKAKYSLGLTATPFRTDKIKLSYEKIISDCGVRFLIEGGYLSNFNQWVIPKFDVSTVCNQYLSNPDRWGKSIVYFKDKKLCLEADQILKSNGISSEVIFGNHSMTRREEIYDQFEEGKIKVLINVYLLTEGFDCPDLQTVFIKDCGRLCTMQMAGRVLRKDPSNPLKVANVVQSESTYYPYTKTAKAKMQYVFTDNEWRSIEAGPQVEQVSSTVRTTILVKHVEIPKYVTDGGMGNLIVNKKGEIKVKKRTMKHESDFFGIDD